MFGQHCENLFVVAKQRPLIGRREVDGQLVGTLLVVPVVALLTERDKIVRVVVVDFVIVALDVVDFQCCGPIDTVTCIASIGGIPVLTSAVSPRPSQ